MDAVKWLGHIFFFLAVCHMDEFDQGFLRYNQIISKSMNNGPPPLRRCLTSGQSSFSETRAAYAEPE